MVLGKLARAAVAMDLMETILVDDGNIPELDKQRL